MKRKPDWPITYCDMCLYLTHTIINDSVCSKKNKYLWTNDNRLTNKSRKSVPYKYMPKWCPLKPWREGKKNEKES